MLNIIIHFNIGQTIDVLPPLKSSLFPVFFKRATFKWII